MPHSAEEMTATFAGPPEDQPASRFANEIKKFAMPVSVCYTYIVLFIIFGAFLERTGIANFFISFANRIAGWSSGGYGNYVVIYHGKMTDGNAYSTLYGHMRSVATSAGKYVKQGELIGYVGSTSAAESRMGPHLHFSVSRDGAVIDPHDYVNGGE